MFKYYYPEKPKLLLNSQPLFNVFSNSNDWVAEYKFNGTRLQLHCMPDTMEFWGRHHNKLTYRPDNDVTGAIQSLGIPNGYNIFDGELRHNKVTGIRNKLVLYDVFMWDGKLLLNETFQERRGILESFLNQDLDLPVALTEQFDTNFNEVYERSGAIDEMEGIVIKNRGGYLNISTISASDSMWMYKVRHQTGRHLF